MSRRSPHFYRATPVIAGGRMLMREQCMRCGLVRADLFPHRFYVLGEWVPEGRCPPCPGYPGQGWGLPPSDPVVVVGGQYHGEVEGARRGALGLTNEEDAMAGVTLSDETIAALAAAARSGELPGYNSVHASGGIRRETTREIDRGPACWARADDSRRGGSGDTATQADREADDDRGVAAHPGIPGV